MAKDRTTAGPEFCAATVPVSTKMPVPTIAPTPSAVRLTAPSARFSRSLLRASDWRSAIVCRRSSHFMLKLLADHGPSGPPGSHMDFRAGFLRGKHLIGGRRVFAPRAGPAALGHGDRADSAGMTATCTSRYVVLSMVVQPRRE